MEEEALASEAVEEELLPYPDANATWADHEEFMLSVITSSKYWKTYGDASGSHARWTTWRESTFNLFTVAMDDESEHAEDIFTGMMMCAFCGVVAMGSPLGPRGVRRKKEDGGGSTFSLHGAVVMMYERAGTGVAPAAAAYPWLASLVEAQKIGAQADAGTGADADAAEDDRARRLRRLAHCARRHTYVLIFNFLFIHDTRAEAPAGTLLSWRASSSAESQARA